MRRKSNIFISAALLMTVVSALFVPLCGAAEITYDAGGRRDPFGPIQHKETSVTRVVKGITLEGIIYDPPANSLALIGGQPYKTGDMVGDGKIIEILKDQVSIEVNGESKTLWIRQE